MGANMQASDERNLQTLCASLRGMLDGAKNHGLGITVNGLEQLCEWALEVLDKVPQPVADIEKTRAELEACQESLGFCSRANDEGARLLTDLREQHEALRAACQACVSGYDRGHGIAETISRLRALLKPASAWQHTSSDGDSHTFRHGETGEVRVVSGFPTAKDAEPFIGDPDPRGFQQPAPVSASLQPLWDAVNAIAERLGKVEAEAHESRAVVAPEEIDFFWDYLWMVNGGEGPTLAALQVLKRPGARGQRGARAGKESP